MNEESINDVSLVSNYEPQKKKEKHVQREKRRCRRKKKKFLPSFANFKRKKTL